MYVINLSCVCGCVCIHTATVHHVSESVKLIRTSMLQIPLPRGVYRPWTKLSLSLFGDLTEPLSDLLDILSD